MLLLLGLAAVIGVSLPAFTCLALRQDRQRLLPLTPESFKYLEVPFCTYCSLQWYLPARKKGLQTDQKNDNVKHSNKHSLQYTKMLRHCPSSSFTCTIITIVNWGKLWKYTLVQWQADGALNRHFITPWSPTLWMMFPCRPCLVVIPAGMNHC